MTLADRRLRRPPNQVFRSWLAQTWPDGRLPARRPLRPPHLTARRRWRSSGSSRNDQPSWGSRPLRRSSREASPHRGSHPTVVARPVRPVAGASSSRPCSTSRVDEPAHASPRCSTRSSSRLACPACQVCSNLAASLGFCPSESDHPCAGATFFDVAVVGAPALPFLDHRTSLDSQANLGRRGCSAHCDGMSGIVSSARTNL